MKSRSKKIISIIVASAVLFGALAGGLSALFAKKPAETHAADINTLTVEEYYSSIDPNSTTLLADLQALNKKYRKSTPGYDGLKTIYKKTDIDPDGSGQLLGFYDNHLIGPNWDSAKTWNREHVWPDSIGGGSVDGDAYMPRPTWVKSNSSRGNAYYAESGAFDPGYEYEDYRGISARIIFYCMVANPSLKLEDKAEKNPKSGSNTMGKLSDMLKWNLKYLPNTSATASPELRCEQNRNNVIQREVQGNRNPFVDHPEYACKIWGNTNSTTKSICASVPVEKTLTGISVSGTLSKKEYTEGETFTPNGLKVTATYSDNSTSDVTNNVTWSPTTLTVGTTKVTASYTYNGVTKTATVSGITVSPVVVEKTLSNIVVTGVLAKNEYTEGEPFDPEGLTVTATFSDGTTENITNNVSWSPANLTLGTTRATCSYTYKGVTKTAYVAGIVVNPIVVEKKLSGLSIVGELNKKEYLEGEAFVSTGVTVIASFTDNTTMNVTNFVTWQPLTLTEGTTSVTASYTYEGVTKTVTISGIVVTKPVEEITLTSLSVSGNLIKSTFVEEESFDPEGLTITATFSDGSEEDVTDGVIWSPSTLAISTTSVTGSYTYNGVTKTVIFRNFTVIENQVHVTEISLEKAVYTLHVGDIDQLIATVSPSNATNKNIIYTSEHEDIVSIDETGEMTALKEGATKVYAISEDGNFSKYATVTVEKEEVILVNEIDAPEEITLKVGDAKQIEYTVLPENAANTDVTFTSSNLSVVTVNNSGLLNAVGEGEALVAIYSDDGNASALISIKVTKNEEHEDDDDDDDPEEEIDKLLGGCFGSIETTSILVTLTALAGFVLLLIKRAKRE